MARILFVDQFASMGGAQRVLLDVVSAFAAEHTCTVAIPGPGEVSVALDARRIRWLPVRVGEMQTGERALSDIIPFVQTTRTIRALVRRERPDFVYVNGPRCALGAVLAGLPTVLAIHNVHSGLDRRVLQWCMERPNMRFVSFCSRAAMRPFQAPRGHVIENWVSPDVLNAPNTRAATRARWGIRDDQLLVGVLGRISPHKGQAWLARALEPLLGPALQLFIAGARDHEDASPFPPQQFVRVVGKMDAAEFLDAIDIQVVPSLWEEPFGLVAIEGMARARPLVATRSGGLVDIVVDGVTGLLTDRVDSEIRAAVRSLVSDAGRRETLARAGALRARNYLPSARLPDLVRNIMNAAAK